MSLIVTYLVMKFFAKEGKELFLWMRGKITYKNWQEKKLDSIFPYSFKKICLTDKFFLNLVGVFAITERHARVWTWQAISDLALHNWGKCIKEYNHSFSKTIIENIFLPLGLSEFTDCFTIISCDEISGTLTNFPVDISLDTAASLAVISPSYLKNCKSNLPFPNPFLCRQTDQIISQTVINMKINPVSCSSIFFPSSLGIWMKTNYSVSFIN